jgi:hypothetical protein
MIHDPWQAPLLVASAVKCSSKVGTTDSPEKPIRRIQRADTKAFDRYRHAMLDRGFKWAAACHDCCLSGACSHTSTSTSVGTVVTPPMHTSSLVAFDGVQQQSTVVRLGFCKTITILHQQSSPEVRPELVQMLAYTVAIQDSAAPHDLAVTTYANVHRMPMHLQSQCLSGHTSPAHLLLCKHKTPPPTPTKPAAYTGSAQLLPCLAHTTPCSPLIRGWGSTAARLPGQLLRVSPLHLQSLLLWGPWTT